MNTHESEVYTVAPEMPAMFDGMKLAAVATVLYVIVRCLNLKSPTAPPDLTYQDTTLNHFLLKSCPVLTKEYIPPLLWGKSGHLQTALYGKLGRVSSPHPFGLRKYLPMQDGATATFDLFEPLADHQSGGCTWEFAAMVGFIKKTYPQTKLIVVGFSLGGNIVCKFLGENRTNQERVLCCVSVCQGYSALRAQETFLQWDQCRRFYNFLMADNMKKIILSHRSVLFGVGSTKMMDADLSRLYTATSLMQIDDNIMRKFHGHNSLKEYYEKESCVHYIHNINVPLLLVNSGDDPLVHNSLLTIPRTLAEKKENVIFALTLHGGHLGFFEGAVLFPQPLTWMDKVIVGYANTICQWEKQKPPCQSQGAHSSETKCRDARS
ncbi:monoacylglycerol lipase ABHD2 isoform X3 [Puntigrus tetrazona]|uniref:monoacylglycerol lipase ABHD2 isoform X3 n=1 Tax=Puntigrus tetrazona TaxID=1606681 RepID=UPI001C899AF5|nr:monoacylglycerol lipase ABHD2 isoform X3 [Puntigrus tetrazona]